MELRRMRSFVSFQPGESRACVGCHESRAVAPLQRPGPQPSAMVRGPSDYILPPWGDRPVSFLRDIQPVLDRCCVSCHSGLKAAGGLDFFGGLTDWSRGQVPGYGFNRAFETITGKKLVSVSEPNRQDATITPPLAYGSHNSKLLAALGDSHHREQVRLAADERLRLTMWIDANAPYHDRFVNKRSARPAYDLAADQSLHDALMAQHARRCAGCHQAADVSRLDWIDIHNARRSLFLTAPLAKAAGGTGKCGANVYRNTSDADYQALLNLIASRVEKAWSNPRRDLQSLGREQRSRGEMTEDGSDVTGRKKISSSNDCP
jgi:mono/diheme cytochrome c family protein